MPYVGHRSPPESFPVALPCILHGLKDRGNPSGLRDVTSRYRLGWYKVSPLVESGLLIGALEGFFLSYWVYQHRLFLFLILVEHT